MLMSNEQTVRCVAVLVALSIGLLTEAAAAQTMPESVRARLDGLQERITTTRAGLELAQSSSASGSDPACRDVQAYSLSDVRRRVQRLREGAIEVAASASAGILDYVTVSFPAPPERDTSERMRTCFRGMRVVAASDASSTFDRIAALVRELRAVSTITIASIRVTSNPSGTAFTLRTRNGRIGFDSATDTTLQNVSRALYVLTVTRPSYRPVTGHEIDLVAGTPAAITCELVLESEADRDSVCRHE
jgi:hypothetical protein